VKIIITSFLFFPLLFFLHAQQSYPYQQYFNRAYQMHNTIPRGMLEAVAWNNTRIRHITDTDEPEGCTGMPLAKGVMGLIDNGKGYFRNTLDRVSQLSGIAKHEILQSPEKNILAYAKAFEQLQFQKRIFSHRPEDYLPILDELSEIPNDNSLLNEFAYQTQLYGIFTFLTDPSNASRYHFPRYQIDLRQLFGSNYDILSSNTVLIQNSRISNAGGRNFNQRSGSRSADYGPAIWNPAASCNYSSRGGVAVSAVTVHTVQGSYAGCISWFQNCNAGVSAHYVIRSSDGQVTQMVRESDKAWHVGSENGYTIGIEHEGYINDASWYTQAMYQSSALLVKDICNSGYGINPLRTHYGPSCSGSSSQCQLGGCIRIKGHQHFPNQTHSDPGPNWNWTLYYHLINDNTPVTTYTAPSGTFYDSGGPSGNYSNDERKLYLIKPTGATQVTLTFSAFNLENNWDFLYVYNGDNLNAPLIGRYTGSTIPAPITSSGNALLVQFRSDCATVAAGWAASWSSNVNVPPTDTIRPVTSVNVPGTWITQNFTAAFSDVDNVNGSGIEKGYYSVHYYHNNQWNANAQRGFRCDLDAPALLSRWTVVTGTWVNENGNMAQTDESLSNTNIYAPLAQNLSNQYLYEWRAKIEGSGNNRRAGFHYFCDNPTMTNRGNSYFLWFREELDQLEIYKVTNDVFSLQKNMAYSFQQGVWYQFKVIYDRITGKHEIYINDKFVMDWTDSSPLSNGSYVSFRSGNSKYVVSDFRVYRSRSASVTVTVGNSSHDIPYENASPSIPAGRICSISKDHAKNLSIPACGLVNVDFSVPPAVVYVNDGIGTDLDSSTVTNSISGSWPPVQDNHSGIAAYYFAIGTAPGSTDLQNWTHNGTQTSFTLSNIVLSAGVTYYISVKSENGAGLQSGVTTSDGIYIYNIPVCSTYTLQPPRITVIGKDTICRGTTATLRSEAGFSLYQWNSGSTDSINIAGPGTHAVTVTDANGCTAANTISVFEYPQTSFFIHRQNITCYGNHDGYAMVQITGGIPPFSYQWSNGSSDTLCTGLSEGSYFLTLTDAHGCVYTDSFSIEQPLPLQVSVHYTYDTMLNQYALFASVSGGAAPYTYNWNNLSGNNPVILPSGIHTLQVTDANGCQIDTIITLDEILSMADSYTENAFELFPNPANDAVTIRFSSDRHDVLIKIINAEGKLQLQKKLHGSAVEIDLQSLTAGIYIVQCTDTHKTYLRKLIVIK
jgi:hypothetical protein